MNLRAIITIAGIAVAAATPSAAQLAVDAAVAEGAGLVVSSAQAAQATS